MLNVSLSSQTLLPEILCARYSKVTQLEMFQVFDGSSWLRLLTGDSGSSRVRFQIDNFQMFRQV